MKDKIFGVLQRVGRSFMLPLALLPVAGLLLGIGGSLTNATMISTYHLESVLGQGTVLYMLLHIMCEAGNVVFANLPLIFAMGVAIGMAKREKEVSALASAIAFFIMHASISALITLNGGVDKMMTGSTANVCGITSLQMGVFGGILVGCGVAYLHNKYYNIQLPQILSFFGGSRFVPIVCSLVYVLVGAVMYFLWPVVQIGIKSLSGIILSSGYTGTFIYGVIERMLIPFGLHHVFYLPIWQTSLGGTMEVGGKMIEGAQNIFFAQLGTPGIERFSVEATRFMSGKFPFMIFGLPGAALAMYKVAKPEKRGIVKGLLISAALTSMVTGITEPIEFTFLFVAPFLYYIHCGLVGLSFMLMHLFKVGVGMTFSGGIIDLFLFGILQGNGKTNWIWVIIVGFVYFFVYYFLFKGIIIRRNLITPGRGDDEEEVKLYTKADVLAQKNDNSENSVSVSASKDSLSEAICNGLGGKKNISDVDCCITRLRCSVFKPELVNQAILKSTGASGVICNGQGIQVVYGPKVPNIKTNLEEYLLTAPNVEYHAEEHSADSEKASEISQPAFEMPESISFVKKEGKVTKGETVIVLKTEAIPFEYVIKDPLGIHARPAGSIVQIVKPLNCKVTIKCNDKTASAASIIELMRLGAVNGSKLEVSAEGREASKALNALKKYMIAKL